MAENYVTNQYSFESVNRMNRRKKSRADKKTDSLSGFEKSEKSL